MERSDGALAESIRLAVSILSRQTVAESGSMWDPKSVKFWGPSLKQKCKIMNKKLRKRVNIWNEKSS